jgi:hypothetical protein
MPSWKEIYEEDNPARRDLARSVCAVCLGDPTAGGEVIGSGFLIKGNQVATACHIFKAVGPDSLLFCVFGYYKSKADQVGFPDISIYLATRSQSGSDDACSTDWACLALAPPGRPEFLVNVSGTFDNSTQMFAIGHLGGEPAKISEDCDVVEDDDDDCFVIGLISEGDASGAPVFNSDNLLVEGIIRELVGQDLENTRCLKAFRIAC